MKEIPVKELYTKLNDDDSDWMQTFRNTSIPAMLLWLMNRVEELEQHIKEDKGDKQCQ